MFFSVSSVTPGRDGVIFIEYVLIAVVNDSPEMAHKLADYLQVKYVLMSLRLIKVIRSPLQHQRLSR